MKTAAPSTSAPLPDATTQVSAHAAASGSVAPSAWASASTSASASTTPPLSRDAATRHILGSFKNRDPEDIGALAAIGISEAGYGLPAEQLKGLATAGSAMTARKDCSKSLASALEASAKPLVVKRCGDFAALKALIAKTPAAKREDAMIKACNLPATRDNERHDPWALLMSAIVTDELTLEPDSAPDEKTVALGLAYTCFPK